LVIPYQQNVSCTLRIGSGLDGPYFRAGVRLRPHNMDNVGA
jgi:hypothetical protein